MQSRIHRISPSIIDVDFQVTDTMILTIQTVDHHSAVELKRQFDELNPDQQREFLKEQLRNNLQWIIA